MTRGARTFAARSLHDICQDASRADCGHCWAHTTGPCVTFGPGDRPLAVVSDTGAPGWHLARFARACRRGLISAADLAAVLQGFDVFAGHTVVFDADGGTDADVARYDAAVTATASAAGCSRMDGAR
jgi:hypothetical protein